MKTHSIHRSHPMQILYLSAMAWACAPATAQGDEAASDAAARHQRERAACFGNPSMQDLSNCLREEAAASSGSLGGGILREPVITEPAASGRQ